MCAKVCNKTQKEDEMRATADGNKEEKRQGAKAKSKSKEREVGKKQSALTVTLHSFV